MDYLRYGVLAVFSFVCIFTDLKSRRIYNTLTIPVIVFALLTAWFYIGPEGLFTSVSGALLGAVLFLPGVYFGKTGSGDLKLSAALGALLGWRLFLIALLAAGIGTLLLIVIVIMRHDKYRRTEYPLGSIMAAAAFAAGVFSLYGFRPGLYF